MISKNYYVRYHYPVGDGTIRPGGATVFKSLEDIPKFLKSYFFDKREGALNPVYATVEETNTNLVWYVEINVNDK